MISEETLTYYYYDDGLDPERRAEVEAELLVNTSLAEQYAALCSELDLLALDDEVPVSDLLLRRLHAQLDKSKDDSKTREPAMVDATHQHSEASGLTGSYPLASRFTAMAATLVIGFGIGAYYFDSPSTGLPENPPANALVSHEAGAEQSVARSSTPFLRGLQVHLRNARLELDKGVITENVDNLRRYQALLTVAGKNRMFEKAAEINHASGLARVLRAFEPSLLRLAEEELTPEQAQALHAKLAFEIDVMLTKLSQRSSNGRYSI